MNETEFLDLLRYYFRNVKTEEVNEILSDYESHFEEGKKRGLSEEEIAKELGSPRDIYDSYQSEGVVDEKTKSAQVKETARMLAKDTAAEAGKAWSQVSPKLPEAAETTVRISARLLTAAGIIISVVILAATALVIALLTMNFAPFHGVPPLPRFSPLTVASITGFGIFTALSVYFITEEGSRAIRGALDKSPNTKGGVDS